MNKSLYITESLPVHIYTFICCTKNICREKQEMEILKVYLSCIYLSFEVSLTSFKGFFRKIHCNPSLALLLQQKIFHLRQSGWTWRSWRGCTRTSRNSWTSCPNRTRNLELSFSLMSSYYYYKKYIHM